MSNNLVFQSDFGTSDGAVSAMYGVAKTVEQDLDLYDITHDIPAYNIWEASYRLYQTISYWPEGTVFVSVVDPGVGSERLSIVVQTTSNHYIVTPDNGTVTHLANSIGIKEVREIDEKVNRLEKSYESYTFHGRDVYAYTGARLATGVITFEEVGKKLDREQLVKLSTPEVTVEDGMITGNIDILDIRFGNLWTNISKEYFQNEEINYGDTLEVTILDGSRQVYKNVMSYGKSFADTRVGEPLLYINSLENIGVALNQGSFAQAYQIQTGEKWKLIVRKAPRIVYS
ncbi:S-adenosyl-l-methionine hydroxide adenosyltransferase family protein [Gracilibacillus sp. S3-1-1]|uniref:S-adenosyl-l-methionine hydroxide adenosyltransferase family protein n=1 Tax=Gracilibacillus pellucidus TaxID=3095368 RepID=A0ACC6M3I2_9BACI|nr:S-adenosyl-l-methionine hydroxide adenosyltransferase family protein [Gracilibacillus sp. S3-1-1]MDX8045519.1 S-adenosyl-l-methionine hydroxide adenosyltransferase family protein [Gracilibacillus sp. S3-1-1]